MRAPPLFTFFPLIWLYATAFPAAAQDTDAKPEPGHSLHGESFSEGPRRRLLLMPGMGDVSFPVTTSSAEAQQFFNQGVAQLHGFWWWEAERSFRTVLALDPECRMANWGLAMANLQNEDRARAFLLKETGTALDKLSKRERSWMEATRNFLEPTKKDDERKKSARKFLSDLEQIASDFPDDLEAKAFVLGQQWSLKGRLELENTSHFAMDLIGQAVLAKNPRHPVHHYLIHLWDGDKTARALQAAAMCGPIAPGIAHMWHMPGHIYSGLQRWSDAAWQQEAAARVDHAQMIRYHIMPDQIHNFAHNSEWLVRNLNNLGRVQDALTISTNLIELPRIPRSAKVGKTPDQQYKPVGAEEHGRSRLRDTMLAWEQWDLAVQLADTPWLEKGGEFKERWHRAQLLALAAFRSGDVVLGETGLTDFEKMVAEVRTERAVAVDAADRKAREENKDGKAIQEAMAEALKPFTPKLDALEPALAELQVLADLAHGRQIEARAKLGRLKGIHDQRLIAIHMALTDFDKALELAINYANRSDEQVQPQAILTDVRWRAGQHGEALKDFETLRKLAGTADLETPLLARLAPVAAAAGVSGDWRQPAAAAADLGDHPPLDTLGPLRWDGWMAPAWTASAPDGTPKGHADLAGHPYVALLVLGGSCGHCNEQIKAFADKAPEFKAADLPVVVVTLDAPADLVPNAAMPVWSGADTSSFKALDAWDDFENKALHTTVVVDATGRIRWQHSGYEPFMRADFLLEEAQRLFKFDRTRPAALAAIHP